MVSEAHWMSFTCIELLLFNYAKVKTVFHSMALLSKRIIGCNETRWFFFSSCLSSSGRAGRMLE